MNFRIPLHYYNILDVIKISYGYLHYFNKATKFEEKIDYTENTIARIISVGIDVKLNSHLNVGVEPRFVFGGFKKMKMNGEQIILDKKKKLNRIEVAIALKLN